MKTYTKLPIPKDTAWDRKTWRRHAPIWFKEFVDGITNIIRWIPTLYRDRDWDDFYITKMLQKKIEFQREYLVKHNRHLSIPQDNRDMTWVLNLIERKHEDYYQLEKYDYEDSEFVFTPCIDKPGYSTLDTKVNSENWDDYLAKYKGAVRRVKKAYPNRDLSAKDDLVFWVARYNQERAEKLLWKIMAERSVKWWD
jgi:hypothetical protein